MKSRGVAVRWCRHGERVMRFDGLDGDGTKDRLRKMTFKELVTFRRNHDQSVCHSIELSRDTHDEPENDKSNERVTA